MGDSSFSVFYENEKGSSLWWILIIAILLVAAGIIFSLYHKTNLRNTVKDTLSEDENKIIDLLRKSDMKQKEIARQLNFSKSKMSKITRRLEEKNLIERTPLFKTNIIKLKKIK
jgi:uncharacterized membrane protein